MGEIITELQDLRYLNWSRTRHSSGTAGSFLKAYDDSRKEKIYYKLSDFDSARGIVGHECVNEIIVDRLLDILGIYHLSYTLINAVIQIDNSEYKTYLCASNDYKQPGEAKISLEDFFQSERDKGESPMEFCIRMGFEKRIYEMLIVDFLILNRDRHGANIEVLRNKKEKSIHLCPLFDHGLSLVCTCHNEKELEKFEIMADKKVQAFIGESSAKENLKLIDKNKMPDINRLNKSDKDIIMKDMDKVLSKPYIDKIWKMIWKRWKYFEDICNS